MWATQVYRRRYIWLMLVGTTAGASASAVKTLIDADALLQRATRSYDVSTIRKLITEDFTLITSSGRVVHAADFVNDVQDRSVKWFNNDPTDVKVRVYNDNCAIVTAILYERYEQNGKMYEHRLRYTDTWVRIRGNWRYVAGHASLLHHPPS